MLSWRCFAEKGGLHKIGAPRLQLQNHGLATRSAKSVRIRQDTVFESFVKIGPTLFNAFDKNIQNAGKSSANIDIGNKSVQIMKRVQEDEM
jgi:hypothetical protein